MIKKSLIICFISLLCLVGCNHDGLPTDDTTAPDNVTETVKDQAVKMTIDKPIEIDQIKSGQYLWFYFVAEQSTNYSFLTDLDSEYETRIDVFRMPVDGYSNEKMIVSSSAKYYNMLELDKGEGGCYYYCSMEEGEVLYFRIHGKDYAAISDSFVFKVCAGDVVSRRFPVSVGARSCCLNLGEYYWFNFTALQSGSYYVFTYADVLLETRIDFFDEMVFGYSNVGRKEVIYHSYENSENNMKGCYYNLYLEAGETIYFRVRGVGYKDVNGGNNKFYIDVRDGIIEDFHEVQMS